MKKKKGFTLVELLVVIAILAILATVSILGYTAFVHKGSNADALYEMRQTYDYLYLTITSGESIVLREDDPDTTETDETVEFYYDSERRVINYKQIESYTEDIFAKMLEKLPTNADGSKDIDSRARFEYHTEKSDDPQMWYIRYDGGTCIWHLNTAILEVEK